MMASSTFAFEDELKAGKDAKKDQGSDDDDGAEAAEADEQG